MDMVGRSHRRNPKSRGVDQVPSQLPNQQGLQRKPVVAVAATADGEQRAGTRETTYKYRDPDKWRAYMRDYMRKHRGKTQTKT